MTFYEGSGLRGALSYGTDDIFRFVAETGIPVALSANGQTSPEYSMYVATSGNAGVGTNLPSAKLHVLGNVIQATNFLYWANATNWVGTYGNFIAQYTTASSNGFIRTVTNTWTW